MPSNFQSGRDLLVAADATTLSDVRHEGVRIVERITIQDHDEPRSCPSLKGQMVSQNHEKVLLCPVIGGKSHQAF